METEKQQKIERGKLLGRICSILDAWPQDSESISKISEQTNLITELGLDSVGIMQLILGIEKEFGIVIKEYELDSQLFSRLGNLISLIEDKIYEGH